MAIHITQIGKARFVCGLFWQSLSRPRELLREAAELGRKIDADLIVIRRDQSTAQAGFAHTRDGAGRALYSLAAAVSKTLALEGAWYDGVQQPVHNWLGAFRLPDGLWVYFAVRDANFLPNGDFAGTREDVLERLHMDYALGGWNVVVGEPELEALGFHNFSARDIDSLLPHRKDGSVRFHRWWRLVQVNRARPVWVLPASAAALAAGSCGVFLYWQAWHAKQVQLERARIEEAQLVASRQHAAFDAPWLAVSRPAVTLQRCAAQLVYMTPGGWQLDEYVCEPDRVRYGWSRHGSTVGMLHAQVPTAEIAPGGDRASLEQPLAHAARSAAPGATAQEALLSVTNVLDRVMTRLQGVGIPFKVTPRTEGPGSAAGAAPAPWHAYTFALDAHGMEPQQIALLLDQPGVRVEKATYRGMVWLIEGVIYGK